MLRNYLTVMIIPQKTSRLIRFELSVILLKVLIISAGALLLLSAAIFFDYMLIREKNESIKELERDVMLQRFKVKETNNLLVEKRQQLEDFAEFDRKLRFISGLQESATRIRYLGGTVSNFDEEEGNGNSRKVILAKIKKLSFDIKLREISFFQLGNNLLERKDRLVRTPSIAPAKGYLSSRFGKRKDPFTGKTRFHRGLDWSNREYTPVFAPADGIVVNTKPDRQFGGFLVIDHGYGIVTRYGHLARLDVKVGKKVRRGDMIGRMGSTGRSTGSHLHYEVLVKDVPVNPEKYLLE